jgi:carbon storage regulator
VSRLSLTRRPGESLRIGDDIEVKVVEINRGQVRIGVTAPKHVPVHRAEIYERIRVERAIAKYLNPGEPQPVFLKKQAD